QGHDHDYDHDVDHHHHHNHDHHHHRHHHHHHHHHDDHRDHRDHDHDHDRNHIELCKLMSAVRHSCNPVSVSFCLVSKPASYVDGKWLTGPVDELARWY